MDFCNANTGSSIVPEMMVLIFRCKDCRRFFY